MIVVNEGKSIKIEKSGEDFSFWKMYIEDYLYKKSMHLSLLGAKPINMKDEEWPLLDKQTLRVI